MFAWGHKCKRDIAYAARPVSLPIPENRIAGDKPHLCTRSVSDFLWIYDGRLTAGLHGPALDRLDVVSTAAEDQAFLRTGCPWACAMPSASTGMKTMWP